MRYRTNATTPNTGRISHITAAFFLLCTAGVLSAQAAPLFSLELVSTSATSTENTGVRARLLFEFVTGPNQDILQLTIANTTPPEIGSSLTAVAFEWPSQIDDPVFAPGGESAYFDQLHYDVNVHPGWINAPQGYDVVITSDGKFEGGSPQGAPREGESQMVRLALGRTGFSDDQLASLFQDFYATASVPWAAARFQAVGCDGERSDKVIVPEPASLWLLSLAALAVTRRRSR